MATASGSSWSAWTGTDWKSADGRAALDTKTLVPRQLDRCGCVASVRRTARTSRSAISIEWPLDLVYREDSLTQIWFNETNRWTECGSSKGRTKAWNSAISTWMAISTWSQRFWYRHAQRRACRSAGN
jgi:hypothetical protein